MSTRQRPAGPGATIDPAHTAQAEQVMDGVFADLYAAHDRAATALASIEHPVERARAALAVRREASAHLTGLADDVFEEAVLTAYRNGKKGHGWYGYGALAEQLGLSRARIQQVVNGTWRSTTKSPKPSKGTGKGTGKGAGKG